MSVCLSVCLSMCCCAMLLLRFVPTSVITYEYDSFQYSPLQGGIMIVSVCWFVEEEEDLFRATQYNKVK